MGIKTNSTILGRTNNPSGKDGMRSGLVVFNEIHQYQDYKNIEVFTTGLGKKPHPRRSYYTTQGDIREGPLDDILETAEEILFGDMPDNGLLPFICRLDSKEEVHDEKTGRKQTHPCRIFRHLWARSGKNTGIARTSGTPLRVHDEANEHSVRISRDKSLFV